MRKIQFFFFAASLSWVSIMAKFLQATYPCMTETTDLMMATGADMMATILNRLAPATSQQNKLD